MILWILIYFKTILLFKILRILNRLSLYCNKLRLILLKKSISLIYAK